MKTRVVLRGRVERVTADSDHPDEDEVGYSVKVSTSVTGLRRCTLRTRCKDQAQALGGLIGEVVTITVEKEGPE